MIIKQYLDVITRRKQQTRRMKPTYQVGRTYSVVHKMYKPTVWYRWLNGKADVWHEHYSESQPAPMEFDRENWTPLKIRITEKRQEPLQNITWEDAIAEGIRWDDNILMWAASAHGRTFVGLSPIDCYHSLWDSINTKKGTRWEDNPMVWVYCFEVVK